MKFDARAPLELTARTSLECVARASFDIGC